MAGGDKPLEAAAEPEFGQRSYYDDEPRQRGSEKRTYNDERMIRLFVDVGHNKSISPSDIVGAIANEGGISGRSIGGIDIRDRFSLVDVPAESVEQVLRQMKNTRLRGMNANIRLADARDFSAKENQHGGESSRDRIFRDKPKRKGKTADRKDRKKSTRRDKPKRAKSK